MLNSWNIHWNCLGGGIQYLLPTMIEPNDDPMQRTPQRHERGAGGGGAEPPPPPPPPSPLWDIEVCTPVQMPKRQRIRTPST